MFGKLAPVAALAIFAAGSAQAADVTPPPSGSVLYSPTPMVTAHVEMGIGAVGVPDTGTGSTAGGFTAAGRANKILAPNVNLELEGGGAGTFGVGGNNSAALFGGFAHLWTMATPTTALGAFGGAAFTGGTTITTAGVEGKVHFGPLDFTGMAVDSFPNGGQSFWTASAGANLYLDPNLRVGAAATFLGAASNGIGNAYVLSADAEKRFKDPISIWGSLNYVGNSTTGNGNLWAALAGLRVFADTPNGTLRSNEDIIPWHFTNPLRTY